MASVSSVGVDAPNPSDNYETVRELGAGGYGAARVARQLSTGQLVVIKSVPTRDAAELAAACREASLLKRLRHPNVVSFIEAYSDTSGAALHIVQEYCEGGDLSQRLAALRRMRQAMCEAEAAAVLGQVALALKHMHDRSMLHRDIKSANIFLTRTGIVKVGDLGIATELASTNALARTQIGTPFFMSPEAMLERPYGRKTDVWSLGVVAYECLMGALPFNAPDLPRLVTKVLLGAYAPLPSRISPGLRALVGRMLSRDPHARPSVTAVLRDSALRAHLTSLLSSTMAARELGMPLRTPSDAAPPPLRRRPSQIAVPGGGPVAARAMPRAPHPSNGPVAARTVAAAGAAARGGLPRPPSRGNASAAAVDAPPEPEPEAAAAAAAARLVRMAEAVEQQRAQRRAEGEARAAAERERRAERARWALARRAEAEAAAGAADGVIIVAASARGCSRSSVAQATESMPATLALPAAAPESQPSPTNAMALQSLLAVETPPLPAIAVQQGEAVSDMPPALPPSAPRPGLLVEDEYGSGSSSGVLSARGAGVAKPPARLLARLESRQQALVQKNRQALSQPTGAVQPPAMASPLPVTPTSTPAPESIFAHAVAAAPPGLRAGKAGADDTAAERVAKDAPAGALQHAALARRALAADRRRAGAGAPIASAAEVPAPAAARRGAGPPAPRAAARPLRRAHPSRPGLLVRGALQGGQPLLLSTIGISVEEILAGLGADVDVELAARAVLDGLAAAGIAVPAAAGTGSTSTADGGPGTSSISPADNQGLALADVAAAATGSDSEGGSSVTSNGVGGGGDAPEEIEAVVVRREVDVLEMRSELERALALTEQDASRDEAAAAAEEGGDGEDDGEDSDGDDDESDDVSGPLEFCRIRASELLMAAKNALGAAADQLNA